MKKIKMLGAVFFAALSTVMAQQKDIAGIWEGKLNVGVTLRIVFHFEKNADGTFSGSLDSPDQGVKGIPCSNVSLSGDSIMVEIKPINGSFSGTLINDSVIDGTWAQGNASFPLNVMHVKEVSKVNRPQTPQPPFNYNSEEVGYDNADKSIHFGGTFTFPKGDGPFPAAILITGSGQQDRDETIFAHKPFSVIADYLTKKGYAVLRVDDRGVGQTTGSAQTATSADFANDVETGLAYLKTRSQVDKNKLGMIGHSEGGLIETIIASRNKDINFIIMLAGPGIKGADLLAEQGVAVMKSSGISEDAVEAYKPLYRQIIEYSITEKDSASAYSKAYPAFVLWKQQQPSSVLSALQMTDEDADKKIVGSLVKAFGSPWMRYFLSTDPQPMIKKFTCKVLALNGSKDIQVIPSSNLAGIKSALEKSKSKIFETHEIDGLNHLFQHCTKCSVQEYGELEETFAPEALEIMGNWLDKNVKNKQ